MRNRLEILNKERIPEHVAIIMDGNGRWAKARGKERTFGHFEGSDSVDKVAEVAASIGVKYLTLYAFSTENWNRPQEEVDYLMNLFVTMLREKSEKMTKNNIRLMIIGDKERLSEQTRAKMEETLKLTEKNDGMKLILAISYSSRWEILKAVNDIIAEAKAGKLEPGSIDEQSFVAHLTTKGIPDPDLLIRTSGELRLSNFLLWQLSYSELYFTDKLWPDFKDKDFIDAIAEYQTRERRYGKTSEQLNNNK